MSAHAQPHPPVGRQPRLAAQHRAPRGGGPPARRPRGHHRRTRDGGRRAVRRDADRAAGQRRRAGPGDDARDRHRGARGTARSSTRHTVGFDELAAHVTATTRPRGPPRSPACRPSGSSRSPAATRRRAPAMIVLGGSSMHKGDGTWTGARAIGCLPALTGNVGHPRRRLRPAPRQRHARPGAQQHRRRGAAADHRRLDPQPDAQHHRGDARRPAARDAAARHQHAVVATPTPAGWRRDSRRHGPRRGPTISSCSDTARRCADVRAAGDRVAGGARLQEHQHAPLPDAEGPRGAGRGAADRVGPARAGAAARPRRTSIPWSSDSGPLDAILDHPATGHATVGRAGRRGRDARAERLGTSRIPT